MNYLALVNETLRESGSTLDQLTGTGPDTFTSPSDPMYTKMKQWVVQAWEDIQTDRRDWEFMQSSAVATLCPRIEVFGGEAALVADFNSLPMSINSVQNPTAMTARSGAWLAGSAPAFTIESGAVASNTAEGYIDIASFADTFAYIEPGDILTKDDGSVKAKFRRWGRYNLQQTGLTYDAISDVGEIKKESFAVCDVFTSSTNFTADHNAYAKLTYVPLSRWYQYGYDKPKTVGKPTHFTISNDGKIELYPPLDEFRNFFFEYTKTPQTFSTYTDTPTGLPDRFHKAISWRALMYYGEYDGISRIYNIAKNRYSKFEYEMVRDLLPEVSIGYDARRF